MRQLEPDEESAGMHNISAVAEDGTVLARYECPCHWCQLWRAAEPMIKRAVADMEHELGIEAPSQPATNDLVVF